MLSKSGESRHHCLVFVLKGNDFNFYPLSMFAVDLLYIAFIMLRYDPSIPTFRIICTRVGSLGLAFDQGQSMGQLGGSQWYPP